MSGYLNMLLLCLNCVHDFPVHMYKGHELIHLFKLGVLGGGCGESSQTVCAQEALVPSYLALGRVQC